MHRRLLFSVSLLALCLTAAPAHGQTIEVTGDASVEVQNGAVLDLEGGTMDLGAAGATAVLSETGAGRVGGGTLTATRALNSPSQADPAGLGAVLTADVDLGDVTVTRGHTVQTAANGNESIRRYYEISPSQNDSGLDATLTHTYHDDELNGQAEPDLVFFKSTDGGTSWSLKGADSRTTSPTGGNSITLNGITSFSEWTLGSEADPLPVELAGFEGTATEDGVQLAWHTASEESNAGFRILRKVGTVSEGNGQGDGSTEGWRTIGRRDGAGTTSGARGYRFTDAELPYGADTLAYRLKQVDTDGTTHLTDPVMIARSGSEGVELLGTVPNPARQRATVRYAVPEGMDSEVTLQLYDVMGRRVRSIEAAAEAGRHEHFLNVGGLASGVYVLRLAAGGTVKTRKVTVVR